MQNELSSRQVQLLHKCSSQLQHCIRTMTHCPHQHKHVSAQHPKHCCSDRQLPSTLLLLQVQGVGAVIEAAKIIRMCQTARMPYNNPELTANLNKPVLIGQLEPSTKIITMTHMAHMPPPHDPHASTTECHVHTCVLAFWPPGNSDGVLLGLATMLCRQPPQQIVLQTASSMT